MKQYDVKTQQSKAEPGEDDGPRRNLSAPSLESVIRGLGCGHAGQMTKPQAETDDASSFVSTRPSASSPYVVCQDEETADQARSAAPPP